LGIILQFETGRPSGDDARSIRINARASGDVSVGFIGAGQFATATLIPAFRDAGARLKAATSATGVSATHAARKLGIEESGTESEALLSDASIEAVVVSTRHASHASWAARALTAGKHVYVEKPLAMTLEDLAQVDAAYRDPSRPPSILMVGFNRRFAPQVRRIKALLEGVSGPKSFVMTVNAGAIPASHWTQDPRSGGGRMVGEACHFIDLLRFLAASPIAKHQATAMRDSGSGIAVPDTVSITLSFADGSIGTIHYFSNGHRGVAKERLDVFAAGRVLTLDNFRKLGGHGWPGFRRMNLWRQDKGHRACVAEFVRAIREGKPAPIDYQELLEVSRVTLEVDEAIANPAP
jgi:predicted dehydrogenase